MFKFNKSTHITIISTFAIIFIVVYLYYTITDLRKLQIEVSKLSKQLQELSASQQQCPLPQATMTFVPGNATPIPSMGLNAPLSAIVEEDASSVSTDEIKQLLDQQEAEEEAVANVTETTDVSQVAPLTESPETTDVTSEPTVEEAPIETNTTKQPRIRKITKKTT